MTPSSIFSQFLTPIMHFQLKSSCTTVEKKTAGNSDSGNETDTQLPTYLVPQKVYF